jgi:nucleotide-binding universal stress UspA family protein
MGSTVFVGFQRILVAYDRSPEAEHAVNIALSMAEGGKAKVFIFAVAQPLEPAERVELEAVLEEARERYEAGFVSIRVRAKRSGIELATEIAVGHPAEQILFKADTIQSSLILMGRRSHSALHRWILGSTSERVLKHAHCPVMIVH